MAGASGARRGKRERRRWDSKSKSWDDGAARALQAVVNAALATAAAGPGLSVIDLGCGTGSLSLPLAEEGAQVLAVDWSPGMLEQLSRKAAQAGVTGIKTLAARIENLDLPAGCADLVVSNYALHHLRDRDKELLVSNAARWLRPGGRLVVGDMMFGRGASPRDRHIIASKIAVMVKRGPSGWWRLAKNLTRFGLRLRERPVSMETWERYFRRAGFVDVSVVPVVSEAAVASGTKPKSPGLATPGLSPREPGH